MGDRIGSLDAAFLELEERDESAHMHIGWALVFDPLPGGERPDIAVARRLIDERLELLPRFRERLSSPRVGRLQRPRWEPDPSFSIENHVRLAALPAPGSDEELFDWLGDFYSHRLDRAHALWETTLLEGLEGGRFALVTKVHHAVVDGVSGATVTSLMLDTEPDPGPGSSSFLEALTGDGDARGGDADGAPGLRDLLSAAARRAVGVALAPRRLPELAGTSRAIAEVIVRDEVIPANPTSLNVAIGATRRYTAVSVPLDELKAIKRRLGGTVNDVVLAAAAGGLRRLLERRGEDLDRLDRMRAMVPVSTRRRGEELGLGNRVSSLFLDLPVAEPDPLLRYRKTMEAAERLKGGNEIVGTEGLIEVTGFVPPLLHGPIAQASFGPRLFNLTITNVPGPQTTLYTMGAPLRRVLPLVPIFAGHAVGIAAVSYDGELVFGLNADRDEVPDLAEMREGIAESIADLRRLVPARQPNRLAVDGPGSSSTLSKRPA